MCYSVIISPTSLIAFMIPTWESPLAPPPPRTKPIEQDVSLRANRAKSECLQNSIVNKQSTINPLKP